MGEGAVMNKGGRWGQWDIISKLLFKKTFFTKLCHKHCLFYFIFLFFYCHKHLSKTFFTKNEINSLYPFCV